MIGKAARRDWKAGAWMLERRYPESYDRNRLRPERIDEVAPTPTAPTPGLDKDGAEEILRIMRKHGLLPPDTGLISESQRPNEAIGHSASNGSCCEDLSGGPTEGHCGTFLTKLRWHP